MTFLAVNNFFCSIDLVVLITPSASTHPFGSPIFLHLAHPYAVRCLLVALTYVKGFRDFLSGLSPRGESAQIAKDVLLDSVDSSGIDLNALIPILEGTLESATKLGGACALCT